MKGGDISNVPAAAVACNVGALCPVPSKSVIDRILLRDPKPIPLHKEAHWGIARVTQDLQMNLIILCEYPNLYNFLLEMQKEHDFPGKIYICPEWDHYQIIRSTHKIEVTLWVAEHNPLQSSEVMHYPGDPRGWFAVFDYLKGAGV